MAVCAQYTAPNAFAIVVVFSAAIFGNVMYCSMSDIASLFGSWLENARPVINFSLNCGHG